MSLNVRDSFRFTVDVVYQRTVATADAELLLVQELHVHNGALLRKQGIEERNEDGLGNLRYP